MCSLHDLLMSTADNFAAGQLPVPAPGLSQGQLLRILAVRLFGFAQALPQSLGQLNAICGRQGEHCLGQLFS